MNETKKGYILDAEGSLGLLALGDIGIKLWREEVKLEKIRKKGADSKDDKTDK